MKIASCGFSFIQRGIILKGFHAHAQQKFLITSQRFFTQWDLVGAVCLERKPVITQPLSSLEKKYLEFLQKTEAENSLLSDHELRSIEDKKIAEKIKKGENVDVVLAQTAQDLEDASAEELKKFQLAPRITEADLSNDQQSIKRKLDATLVLVVKQKLGNDYRWVFPQSVHQEGETLRQTAERTLKEMCPDPAKVQFMGDAPVGHYKYKYPKVIRGNGIIGAKVFFFKAQLLHSKSDKLSIEESETIADHKWLTHSELQEVLQPVYCKTVQTFLFPDTFKTDDENTLQPDLSDKLENQIPTPFTHPT